jgi:ABC-type transport system involved in Fe-S cluster assembly fused permease/ATPase subunit
MNALDNERESRATDMLLNYETIKYFCAEGRELDGYDDATRKYQAAEYWQVRCVRARGVYSCCARAHAASRQGP